MLDIGCGSESMFMDLLENGACEIEGIDISNNMVEIAKEKFCFDPRIHVTHGDFLEHEQPAYDVLMAFNSYQHFPQPRVFLERPGSSWVPGAGSRLLSPLAKNMSTHSARFFPPV